MNRTKNVQGVCSVCGGHFEFAAEQIGLTTPCPVCGKETELQLATPESEPMIPRRVMLWTAITLAVLMIGLGLCMLLLRRAERLAQQERPTPTTSQAPASSPNPIPGYEVSPIQAEKSPDGSIYAVGEVTNTSDHATEGFGLRIQIADAAGKVIGVATIRRTRFAPRERWVFHERIPNPRAASFRLAPDAAANP